MIKKRSARMAVLACASVASLGLLAGASPAAGKTVTKTATFSQCFSTAVAIPEYSDTGNSASAAFAVALTVPNFKGKPQDGVVTAVNGAGVRITHTFDEDLVLNLVSPGGKAIALANRRGSSGDGYGSGTTSCSGSLVGFSGTFTTPIATPGNTASNPIVGNFRPEQPLSTFVGGPARGFWTLVVTDTDAGDVGALHAFSLNMTYTYKALKKKKKKK
jgi:proprotein convertase P-domain-containing protein